MSYLKDISQIFTAIALVVIGWLTWNLNKDSFELSSEDNAEKQVLLREIDELTEQRSNLKVDIDEIEQRYQSSLAEMTTVRRQTDGLRRTADALSDELVLREEEISEVQTQSDATRDRLISLQTNLAVETLNSTLLATIGSRKGRGLWASDFVGFHGELTVPNPLEFYYPPSKQFLWAELGNSLREEGQKLPAGQKEIGSRIVEEFIIACKPVGSPERIEFNEPLPQFEPGEAIFPTSRQVYEFENTQREEERNLSRDERRRWRNWRAVSEYTSRFNSARGGYLMAVWDEMFLCPASVLLSDWTNVRSNRKLVEDPNSGSDFYRFARYQFRD